MIKVTDEKRRDKILNGPLLPVLISICAPLFIYNFFNSWYSILDSIFVSKISSSAVSAVASLSQIKALLSSLGAGIAGGGGIIVARLFGAGKNEEGRKNANVLFTMGLVVVLFVYVVFIPLAVPIMKVSGVPDELIAIGTGYFILQLIELGFVAFNNIFIALTKSKGDTKSIFYLNLVSMAIKIVLNYIFIYQIKVTDILWVEVSTIISQFVLFAILFIKAIKKDNIFRISIKELSLRWRYVKPILIMSVPIFLGKFIFSFGKVSVNGMCKKYGPLVVGALGASNNINGLATSPINSIEEGESTIVSQNLGNRNIKRALEAFTKSLFIALILGTIGYILIRFIFQDALINLFSQNKDDVDLVEFLALVKSINRFDSLSIPSLAINAAVLGVLYGFGQTKSAMVLNISRVFVFRIPVLWYLQTFHTELGAECAGISMGISNICIAITSIIFLVFFLIRIKRKGYNGMSLDTKEELA